MKLDNMNSRLYLQTVQWKITCHFPHLENFGAMFTMEKKKTDLYRIIVLFGQSRKPAYCNVISSKKV